jgi:hypothetical protein
MPRVSNQRPQPAPPTLGLESVKKNQQVAGLDGVAGHFPPNPSSWRQPRDL